MFFCVCKAERSVTYIPLNKSDVSLSVLKKNLMGKKYKYDLQYLNFEIESLNVPEEFYFETYYR